MIISKSITSQPGWQTIAIHILTNISRSNDNQTMKPGQLVEHNLRSLFLEKPYANCVEETVPRPFSKKSKLSISLNQYSEVLFILFLLFGKLRTFESDWNYAADHLLLPHIKLFQKAKRGLDLVLFPHFLHDFWRKIFLLLYSITWPNFNVCLALLREIFGNMCILIVC